MPPPCVSEICAAPRKTCTGTAIRAKKDHRDKCIRYYGVIGIFAVGAVMGSVLTAYLRERTIWVSCGLLLVSFLIMFVKEDIEGGRR